MRKFFIIVSIFFLSSNGWSQPRLRNDIGLFSAPGDSDSVCSIIPYYGTFDANGVSADTKAFDFTLYDRLGNPLTLSKILTQKKPVLLISGSYTCPIFRFQVPTINEVVKRYGDQVNIYIVYTFEAHPVIDEQPFGDDVESDNRNQQENILFRQPKNYGERKSLVDSMLKSMEINAPVIIDGPCNEWATHFGPAPNNAYLIDTSGTVVSKHPWFNRSPNDIIAEIATLLQGRSENTSPADSGIFSFNAQRNLAVSGTAGETLELGGFIVNASNADAIVNIARIQNDLPSDWKSSLCSNVCFSTATDSTSLRILSHSSQEFKVYFYTSKNRNQGDLTLQLSNPHNPLNKQTLVFHATTEENASVLTTALREPYLIKLFPNPVIQTLNISTALPYTQLRILNELGRTVFQDSRSESQDVSILPAGIYYIQLYSAHHSIIGSAKFIKD